MSCPDQVWFIILQRNVSVLPNFIVYIKAGSSYTDKYTLCCVFS